MDLTAGLDAPRVWLGERPGSVTVTATLPAPLDETWSALTNSARVEQWFGALSSPLAPGAHVRLDFGDGDFFDLDVEEVDKPTLRWSWRFMGCGARDAIELRLEEIEDGGSQITVTDCEPHRSRDAALELGEGWRDFAARLQLYLATGEQTRYDWRSDVEVWAELPLDAVAARRLVIESAAEWLPLEPGAVNLLTASALVLTDGEQPERFFIYRVRGTGAAAVAFDLRPGCITGTLPTEISVAPHGDDAVLSVSQTGFRTLITDDASQRRIRQRFAAAWLDATTRAVTLTKRPPLLPTAVGSGLEH